jgi:hypothetical protein
VITLVAAGAAVQRAFLDLGWRFCFIGGIANFRWGTPRVTNDLDLTLFTGFGQERTFVDELLRRFRSRVSDPVTFAAANRVLLLATPDGIGVDVALGAMPFEAATIERSSMAELARGIELRTCSAEDLIVHKAFASRPQDWVDVEGVVVRQQGRLNWAQVRADLGELVALKGEPEILVELDKVIHRAERTLDQTDPTA